jgi:acetone carboxylase, alpha subunit
MATTGYRFEAHKTGLKERIGLVESLPLGGDTNPDHPDYENHLNANAIVKRDKQCMTTEDCYDNYDLYLNYLRGGPGFGDPLDRDVEAIERDLNNALLLPEYAQKVYGALATKDANGIWTVDAQQTALMRLEIRNQRLARSQPTREWMKGERDRILIKHAAPQVQHMFATSFGLSKKFEQQFRTFWDLPDSWALTEDELDVPTYGSKYRMDLSKMPDVNTVVLVAE